MILIYHTLLHNSLEFLLKRILLKIWGWRESVQSMSMCECVFIIQHCLGHWNPAGTSHLAPAGGPTLQYFLLWPYMNLYVSWTHKVRLPPMPLVHPYIKHILCVSEGSGKKTQQTQVPFHTWRGYKFLFHVKLLSIHAPSLLWTACTPVIHHEGGCNWF